jgi:phosphate acetyltransferase
MIAASERPTRAATVAILRNVLAREAKLHAGRPLSHCALVSVPTYARRFVISDAALNIAPDTDQKREICQNAIGFARALGIPVPKVAVLAAVETIHTKMSATLDGAILAEMADRGQIAGGIVDGPLDLDAAVDAEAAKIKHIESPVAGNADILIAPNIEAGNMIDHDLQGSGVYGQFSGRRPRRRCQGPRDPDEPRRRRC